MMSVNKSTSEGNNLESQDASNGFLKRVLSGDLIPYMVFIIIGYLAFGLFFAPAIFMDDWTSVIERIVTGNASWLDPGYRNPLLFTPFLIQYQIFELNLTAYYAILWSLYILITILLYKIVKSFPLPHARSFGFVVAILFLIYPTNYTHMYLIQLGIYCGIVLTFLFAYMLLMFARGASWLNLVIALLSLLFSFGFYEGQIGVASAWILILAILFHRVDRKRLMGIISPIFISGLFTLWRTFGFQLTGIEDQYLSRLTITPAVLMSRLLLGYKISLGWGWTYSLEQLIPWISGAKIAALFLLSITAILYGSFNILSGKIAEKDNRTGLTMPLDQRWRKTRPYLYSMVIGLVLIGAGYIPVMIVYLPGLSGIGSRHNLFATIGSSLFFASIFMIGVILLTKSQKLSGLHLLVAVTPLIMLGTVTQASVQYHNRVAWSEQKHIWQGLFSAAPDIKNGTMVLLILPDYQERSGYYNWKRTPLSASWEISSGLRLLYNNATLSADVYFPDIEEPIEPLLNAQGVFTRDTGTLVPYARTVAYLYDHDRGELVRLDELPVEMIQDADQPVVLCQDCILVEPNHNVPLRTLVQESEESQR